ncbi:MAG: hypothetical protein methR_P3821 [Methyloprofundus sp.]|nr:MAG: hypothetical protein methR_P3821 [Methyloprofundus sp.]
MIKVLMFLLLTIPYCSATLSANEQDTISKITIGWYFPGINKKVSRTDFQIAINFWMDEFGKPQGIEDINSRLFDSVEKMKIAFNNSELDYIVAPPLLFVKYFDMHKVTKGIIAKNITGKPYGVVVLVRKELQNLSELKNKRLVMPDNDELAEVFLETLVIPEFKQSYSQVFSSVNYTQKHNTVVHQLFFNQADVGVTYLESFDLMVELNPQIADKIKILANFPIDSPNYSFFHKKFPEKLRDELIAAMIKLNKSDEATQIFNGFMMESLLECSVESLEPFYQLNERYKQLKQQISGKSR